MSLQNRLSDLIDAIAADTKGIGDLSQLSTTAKTNLVAALNEVLDSIGDAAGINDAATGADSTWSSSKISDAISDAISDLVDNAPAALDTLKELADMLSDQDDAVSDLATAIAGKVSYAEEQSLSTESQARACVNIGIGDPETDYVALYEAAKAA
jgi:hypothetical protein